MAKIVGINGSLRGRIGATVFCKGEKGVSYARSYQPQVANPRTPAQLVQRAKANVAGRLSSIVPASVLVLGGNKRVNRRRFLKHLLEVAVVDTSAPGTYVGKLAPASIVFSVGGESIQATMSATAVTANSVSLSLTLGDAALANRYGERIIVGVVTSEYKEAISVIRAKEVILTSTTAQSVTIDLPVSLQENELVCVYRCPFVISEEGASIVANGIYTDASQIVAALVANENNFRGWGNSVLALTQVFTQA